LLLSRSLFLENNTANVFPINIQWTGTPPRHPDVISWKDLVSLGKDKSEDLLAERQKQLAINQVSISSTFYAQRFCQYFGAKKLQHQT
jgi:hypothetical protein